MSNIALPKIDQSIIERKKNIFSKLKKLNIYSNAIVYGLEEALEGPYKKEGLDINNVENWPVDKINWVPQELKENVGRSLTDRFNNFKTNLKNNRT